MHKDGQNGVTVAMLMAVADRRFAPADPTHKTNNTCKHLPPPCSTPPAMSTTFPTFQDYTFDLASRLQQAAAQSLKEFEASIARDGFDWLDGYLDNLAAQDRRPIAELIKTPSRTATAKKTRTLAAAGETAARDRAEQIRRFNARVALSPLMSPDVGLRAVFALTSRTASRSRPSARRCSTRRRTHPSREGLGRRRRCARATSARTAPSSPSRSARARSRRRRSRRDVPSAGPLPRRRALWRRRRSRPLNRR